MRYYYAHHNPHGVGTVREVIGKPGVIDRLPGTVYRFPSKAERDAWVADDVWDGNYHRVAISSNVARSEARKLARYVPEGYALWTRYDDNQPEALAVY